VTTLVTGTMLLTWVGEIVSRYGVVNGISLLIFIGIASNLIPSVVNIFEKIRLDGLSIFWLFVVFCICIFSVFVVVFIEQSIRYITVTYISRQKGKRLYAAQKNTLPLKINMAGVMAPIFASSVLLFPTTLMQWAELSENSICSGFFYTLSSVVEPGTFGYIILFVISIFFFNFLYTSIVFNSSEISSNLKKSGAFITNCRPGLQTTLFINFVVNRLTVLGSVYIVSIAILPEIFMLVTGVSFYFGGTSILILVVVSIELISSIQTHLLSVRYKKIIKNSSFF
jgi:preprotein translocase subunit SecY